MRSDHDLFGAFDSVDTSYVDPDEMLARVHSGSATLQTARRRRVAVISVSAAAVLIAVGAVVVPSLGADRPDRGEVANTPSATPEQHALVTAPALTLGFSVPERPAQFSSQYMATRPGEQVLSLQSEGGPQDDGPSLEVRLFDPELSGMPIPELTGESIVVESASSGPLTAQAIAYGPLLSETSGFGLAWQVDNRRWLTIVAASYASQADARAAALAMAAQLVVGPSQPFTFPFQVGYVPADFVLTGANRLVQPGLRSDRLDFGPSQDPVSGTTWMVIRAENTPGVPEYSSPNTTIGPYQAELILDAGEGAGASLSIFGVDGFLIVIEISTSDPQAEAEARQIGESIIVIPGAAADPTVWTEQPIG